MATTRALATLCQDVYRPNDEIVKGNTIHIDGTWKVLTVYDDENYKGEGCFGVVYGKVSPGGYDEIVLALRGTNSVSDWDDDLYLFLQSLPDQYEDALEFYNLVKQGTSTSGEPTGLVSEKFIRYLVAKAAEEPPSNYYAANQFLGAVADSILMSINWEYAADRLDELYGTQTARECLNEFNAMLLAEYETPGEYQEKIIKALGTIDEFIPESEKDKFYDDILGHLQLHPTALGLIGEQLIGWLMSLGDEIGGETGQQFKVLLSQTALAEAYLKGLDGGDEYDNLVASINSIGDKSSIFDQFISDIERISSGAKEIVDEQGVNIEISKALLQGAVEIQQGSAQSGDIERLLEAFDKELEGDRSTRVGILDKFFADAADAGQILYQESIGALLRRGGDLKLRLQDGSEALSLAIQNPGGVFQHFVEDMTGKLTDSAVDFESKMELLLYDLIDIGERFAAEWQGTYEKLVASYNVMRKILSLLSIDSLSTILGKVIEFDSSCGLHESQVFSSIAIKLLYDHYHEIGDQDAIVELWATDAVRGYVDRGIIPELPIVEGQAIAWNALNERLDSLEANRAILAFVDQRLLGTVAWQVVQNYGTVREFSVEFTSDFLQKWKEELEAQSDKATIIHDFYTNEQGSGIKDIYDYLLDAPELAQGYIQQMIDRIAETETYCEGFVDSVIAGLKEGVYETDVLGRILGAYDEVEADLEWFKSIWQQGIYDSLVSFGDQLIEKYVTAHFEQIGGGIERLYSAVTGFVNLISSSGIGGIIDATKSVFMESLLGKLGVFSLRSAWTIAESIFTANIMDIPGLLKDQWSDFVSAIRDGIKKIQGIYDGGDPFAPLGEAMEAVVEHAMETAAGAVRTVDDALNGLITLIFGENDFSHIMDDLNGIGDIPITITGHGLGGSLAELVAAKVVDAKVEVQAETFNAMGATNSLDDVPLSETADYNDITNWIIEGDKIGNQYDHVGIDVVISSGTGSSETHDIDVFVDTFHTHIYSIKTPDQFFAEDWPDTEISADTVMSFIDSSSGFETESFESNSSGEITLHTIYSTQTPQEYFSGSYDPAYLFHADYGGGIDWNHTRLEFLEEKVVYDITKESNTEYSATIEEDGLLPRMYGISVNGTDITVSTSEDYETHGLWADSIEELWDDPLVKAFLGSTEPTVVRVKFTDEEKEYQYGDVFEFVKGQGSWTLDLKNGGNFLHSITAELDTTGLPTGKLSITSKQYVDEHDLWEHNGNVFSDTSDPISLFEDPRVLCLVSDVTEFEIQFQKDDGKSDYAWENTFAHQVLRKFGDSVYFHDKEVDRQPGSYGWNTVIIIKPDEGEVAWNWGKLDSSDIRNSFYDALILSRLQPHFKWFSRVILEQAAGDAEQYIVFHNHYYMDPLFAMSSYAKYMKDYTEIDLRGYDGAKILGEIYSSDKGWNESQKYYWISLPFPTGVENYSGQRQSTSDPLVFDLDGDGFETTSLVTGTAFDFDENFTREQMSWVGPDDGFLFLDRNGNGVVDGGAELFSTQAVLSSGEQARSVFDVLEDIDTNRNGYLDSRDQGFDFVRIWRDLNQNGVSEPDEIFKLDELGISSVGIDSTEVNEPDGKGNTLLARGTYQRKDGSEGDTGFFLLDRDVDIGVAKEYLPVPGDVVLLPDVKGSNDVFDLHQAIIRDESGTIRSLVENFMDETDPAARDAIVDSLLLNWAGSSDVSPGSRGIYVDARILDCVEKFYGKAYLGLWGADPDQETAIAIEQTYQRLHEKTYALLMSQSHLHSLFNRISGYRWDPVSQQMVANLSGVISTLNSRISSDPATGKQDLAEFARCLRALEAEGMLVDYEAFRSAFASQSEELARIVDGAGRTPITGTEGDDSLIGTHVNDTIEGGTGNDTLWGDTGDDTLIGGDGHDTLRGAEGADRFYGGAGDDHLEGGTGDDVYWFGRGSGHDTIYEEDTTPGNTDTIEIAGDISPEEIAVTRETHTLVLTLTETGDQVSVTDWFYDDRYKVEVVTFADGTVWDIERLNALLHVDPTEGPDVLFGSDNADPIDGLGGNDYLFGGRGDDTLLGGSGHDEIRGDWDNDTLSGGTGDDILYGDEGADHLSGDEGADLLDGGYGNDVLQGGAGDDILYGGDDTDDLDGGPGNDLLYGDYNSKWWATVEMGNDIYHFGRGSGQDTIVDTAGSGDKIVFADDIAGGEVPQVTVSRDIWNLYLTIDDTGDRLTIENWFYQDKYKVEVVEFADGTTWSVEDLRDMSRVYPSDGNDELGGGTANDKIDGLGGNDLIYTFAGDDTLHGGDGNDTLDGGEGGDTLFGDAGNDMLTGGDGDDVLDGGTENDMLRGGPGSDTYWFGRDSGSDTIEDQDFTENPDAIDTLSMADGVLPADVIVTRGVDDLCFIIRGSTDQIVIKNHFHEEIGVQNRIEQVQFADGTIWDQSAIEAMLVQTLATEGDEEVSGTPTDDVLDGLGGNDEIHGFQGNDVLIGGSGSDYLYGDEGNDTLSGGTDNDRLYGGEGADILDGGAGDDRLQGEAGDDIYHFGPGSGNDELYDWDRTAGNIDTVRISEGIVADDITVTRDVSHLFITIKTSGDTLTLLSWFQGAYYKVERVEFADGTVWDEPALEDQVAIALATQMPDGLHGTKQSDVIDGLAGNDKIYGYEGDDILTGGLDDDSLYGGEGADTLSGGEGNDYLEGSLGEDVYHFAKGGGQDSIYDQGTDADEIDTILFADDTVPDDVIISRDRSNLYLTISDTGDRITIQRWFADDRYKVEQITFSDGTVWDEAELSLRTLPQGTSDGDIIYGSADSDTIDGLEGEDKIYGHEGDDTLYGGTGWDHLYGEAGNDILDGGPGNDRLEGGAGNDTYVFGQDVGNDTIREDDRTPGNIDSVQFADGIEPGYVAVTRDNANLYLTIADTGKTLTVENWFKSDYCKIEQVIFSNGTTWDVERLLDLIPDGATSGQDWLYGSEAADIIDGLAGNDHLYGGDGNDQLTGGGGSDSLYGESGNDILEGSIGNDSLYGGVGDDTYLFGDRFGQDVIADEDSTPGNIDTLRLVAASASDVKVSRDEKHLYLTIVATGDRITVSRHFENEDCQIEQVEFADGTVWNMDDLTSFVSTPTLGDDFLVYTELDDTIDGLSGDDEIWGLAGNDTLFGGEGRDCLWGGDGDDVLDGGPGVDTYFGGAGADTFVLNRGEEGASLGYLGVPGYDRYDSIRMGAGIMPADVQVLRTPFDLTIAIKNTTGRLALGSFFYGDPLGETPHIDRVAFADGTVWDQEKLLELSRIPTPGYDWIFGTRGDDVLYGGDGGDNLFGSFGNDILDGGAGRDGLQGEEGDDTYLFGRGSGVDSVLDGEGADDTIRMTNDVSSEDVTVTRDLENLYLTIVDTGDRIEIRSWFKDEQYQIERVEFADGTVWDKSTIQALLPTEPTEGVDVLSGTEEGDEIDGLGGDDYLYGLGGDDILYGGSGGDHLYGEDGDDTLEGHEGSDRIYGGDDADILYGGEGYDSLYGNDGDDYLDGGPGNDYLCGDWTRQEGYGWVIEAGSDTYFFDRGYGHDTIYEKDGSSESVDTVLLAAGILPDDVTITQDLDSFYLLINDTEDWLSGLEYIEQVKFDDNTVWDKNELLKRATKDEATYNEPSAEGDLLYGTEEADTIDGLGGDDVIYGGAGNDVLLGSEGNDRLEGGTGDDTLEGGVGTDKLYGAAGDDTLYGREGSDELVGLRGDDVLDGGPGDDFLYGGNGWGGPDPQYDPGNDTYLFGRGAGKDVICDNDTTVGNLDTIRIEDIVPCETPITPEDIQVTRDLEHLYLTILETGDQLKINYWFVSQSFRIERVVFYDGSLWDVAEIHSHLPTTPTEGTDVLYFDYEDNIVNGLGGDDYLYGRGGSDSIDGGTGDDYLYGEYGNDILLGGEGKDALFGGPGDDILNGGPGNDSLEGGEDYTGSNLGLGNDTYLFGRGSGYDTISDRDSTPGNVDTIRMGDDVAPADVAVSTSNVNADPANLVLCIRGTSDKLVIYGWVADDACKVERVEFHDGTVWDIATLQTMISTGTGVGDTLVGTNAGDTIDGGAGNDWIYGLAGDDILAGGEGVDYLYGSEGDDILEGGDGDDTLYSGSGEDILDGGTGNDRLFGWDTSQPQGNDTYRFGRNYGHDIVYEDNTTLGNIDTVQMADGVAPADVRVTRDHEHLYLTILDTGDVMTIMHWFVQDRYKVEQVVFADNTVWDVAILTERANQATENADTLIGTTGDDMLAGLGGDDSIYAQTGDDILDGGPGDDLLDGGAGSDAYLFGRGGGKDTVTDYDYTDAQTDLDVVRLDDDLMPSDVSISRDIENLYVTIQDTGERLTLTDWFIDKCCQIEQIAFADADGTVWDVPILREMVLPAPTEEADALYGTLYRDIVNCLGGDDLLYAFAGDDEITGGDGNDKLHGGEGDDKLYGNDGDDTIYGGIGEDILEGNEGADKLYGNGGRDELDGGVGADILEGGYGHDTLQGGAGHDELRGGDGNDILFGGADTDTLEGGPGDDILDGGIGDDVLDGGGGNDVYHFAMGSGHDTIEEYDPDGTDTNIVVMGESILSEDVFVRRDLFHLYFTIGNSGDQMTVTCWFSGETYTIDRIEFADGTVWDTEYIKCIVDTLTEGPDFLVATDEAETIDMLGGHDTVYAGDGNDTVHGNLGNDTIYGEEGDDSLFGDEGSDVLYGGYGNDIVDGGPGNDNLYGEWDSDTYLFGRGSGQDTLRDHYGSNMVQMANGVAPQDIRASRDRDNLYLTILDSGDQLKIEGWVWHKGVAVAFSDNTVWDEAELVRLICTGTDGDDVLYVMEGYETLNGGPGNDLLYGGNGADVLRGDDGSDKLYGGGGIDTLMGGAGADHLDGGDGNDIVYGGAGNDNLVGGSGNNLLDGGPGDDRLHGDKDADKLMGMEGDDYLSGHNGNDTLNGGPGKDELQGGSGCDVYIFGRGFGQDTVKEGRQYYGYVPMEGAVNTVQMEADVLPSDLAVTRDAASLYLTITDTGECLKIEGWFESDDYKIHRVEFSDGTVWGVDDIRHKVAQEATEGNDVLYGTMLDDMWDGMSGDDKIYGGNGNDVLQGNIGNDYLWGQGGNDTLTGDMGDDCLFGESGNDVLSGGEGNDWLVGGAGVDVLDGGPGNDNLSGGKEWGPLVDRDHGSDTYRFGRGYGCDRIYDSDYKGGDVDRILMTADVVPEDIVVSRDLHNIYLTIQDTSDQLVLCEWFSNAVFRIEEVVFADGTVWDPAFLVGLLPTPTEESDFFVATDSDDIIDCLGGDDTVYAGMGSDIVYGGEGNDTIRGEDGQDELYGDAGADTLSGGAGHDILYGGIGDDRLDGHDGNDTAYGGDGNDWIEGGPGEDILEGGAGKDNLAGGSENDLLFGNDGDDGLGGESGNDTLDGGPGNDLLSGGAGDDIFLFGRGSGQDKLSDSDGMNTIQMAADVTPQDILVSRDQLHVYLSIVGSNDQLKLEGWFQHQAVIVAFADGTRWDEAVLLGLTNTPTDGDDILHVTEGCSMLDGGAGNDVIYGSEGDDVLFGGEGNDTLYGYGGADALDGGAGDDTLFGGAGDSMLYGGPGNDRLCGSWGDEILDGGPGNDSLGGGSGNDTYVFGKGYGHETIGTYSTSADEIDTLQFTADILPGDIVVTRDYYDLILLFKDTDDRIDFHHWFTGGDIYKIDQIAFSDGTIWDQGMLDHWPFEFVGTEGDDRVSGYSTDEILLGLAGNDILSGGQGDDILDGGSGNDVLYGNIGNDVYVFGRGFDQDIIKENDGLLRTEPDENTVRMTGSLLPSELEVTRDVENLYLAITDTGDRLTIEKWFASDDYKIHKVEFSDGTVWGVDDIRRMVAQEATEGNDVLYGTTLDDTWDGLAGDDGIYGSRGNDILAGGEGRDCLIGGYGDDTLDGGPGDDELSGGGAWGCVGDREGGSDTYRFGRGYGRDRIYDYDRDETDVDRVLMNSDILPNDVAVRRDLEHLYLIIQDTGDELVLMKWLWADRLRIEEVVFADGTVWDEELLMARVLTVTEGPDFMVYTDADETIEVLGGNDTVYARGGNDIIVGGEGDDTLYGELGNDTYRFGRGSGQDTIYDYDTTSGNMDTIELAKGIVPEDVRVGRNGDNLVLLVPDTEDSVLVDHWFSGAQYKVENITFDNGTMWDVGVLAEHAVWMMGGRGNDTLCGNTDDNLMDGLSGNDRLYGKAGADILDGGLGNDTLYGEAGNDTYLFGRDSGIDTVFESDNTPGNIDTVEFADDISPNDLWIVQDGDHLRFVIKNTGDCLTIDHWFADDQHKVEKVVFADGTVWDVTALIENAQPIATEGSEEIFGTKGDDTFDGLSGDDNIYGRDGSDTLSGSGWNDQLYGEAGNDTLSGGEGCDYLLGGLGEDIMDGGAGNDGLYGEGGNDCYLFGRGFGQDWILEYDETVGNMDIVRFSSDVLPDDILMSRDFCNLYLTITDTDDRLTVLNYFSHDAYEVERIEFADGTVWDESVIADRTTVEYEAEVEVTMDLPAGWSMISLPVQPEVATVGALFPEAVVMYKYQKGAGYVRVQEGENLEVGEGYWIKVDNTQSYVIKGTEITEYAIPVADGWYMIGGCTSPAQRMVTSGEIEVIYEYTPGSGYKRVPASQPLAPEKGYWILFSNNSEGEVLWATAEDLNPIGSPIVGTTGNDILHGDQGDNIIKGFSGHDQLHGGEGDDTLDGGPGNDQLYGEAGNDTYRFERGSGLDTISDYDTSPGNIDTIQLTDDITPADIKVNRNLNSLCFTIVDAAGKSTGDQITVENWFLGEEYRIERVAFADGTVWDIKGFTPPSPTEAADILYGTIGDDMIDGRGGDDVIYGLGGDDTYHFNPGSGQDTINDYDTTAGDTDTIKFGEGIAKEDIAIFQNGSNLQIDYGNGDIVTIQNQSDSAHAIEQVETNDGYYLTNEDINTIIQDMTAFATDNGIPFNNIDDVRENDNLMNIVINSWKVG